MKDEQINIAIAEACGYKNVTIGVTEGAIRVVVGYKHHNFDEEIPDYCNDPNAMHEAEGVLTIDELTEYRVQLSKFVIAPFRATALQRAEAFLKTINKWEGESDE